MENINEIIGNNIKELRKFNKLTQFDLAEQLNYSNKTISRWESGDIIPDVQTLNKLSEFFNVPLSSLFEPDLINKRKLSKKYRFQLGNKLTIALLFILCVWLMATVIFVHSMLTYNVNYWQIFVWAVPASALVGLIFNHKWGRKSFNFLIISIFNWTLITSIFVSAFNYTFWMLYLIGIPVQIGILLWANIAYNNKSKKS